MLDLYVEIDAHDVHHLALHAAQRYSLDLYVVTHDYLPADDNLHLILGQEDQGGGAPWILANIKRCDICVTGNSGLAVNCVLRGALVLSPTGEQWGVDAMNAGDLCTAKTPCFSERLERMIAAAMARADAFRTTSKPFALRTSRQRIVDGHRPAAGWSGSSAARQSPVPVHRQREISNSPPYATKAPTRWPTR
jgi:uncharacterized protein YaiI (UPF0178 family)